MKTQEIDIRRNPYIKAILQPGGIEHTCTYVKSEGRVYIKTAACTFCVDLNGEEVSVVEEPAENRALQEIAKFLLGEATRFVEIQKLRDEMNVITRRDAQTIGGLNEQIKSLQFANAAKRGAYCQAVISAKALAERWQKSSVPARRQDAKLLKNAIKKAGVNWQLPSPKDDV